MVPDERLYNLMPAIYRIRDVDDGQTLRAFMAVLERVYQALHDDLDGLYDDWFIETCQERIAPYLADLVGVSDLLDTEHIQGTRRRRIANITSYRRTTGTLSTIEDIARDLTGWPVHTLDLAGLVAITQHVQHARPERNTLVDVRTARPNKAFDTSAHGVDVRQIAPDGGRSIFRSGGVQGHYNLSDIGLFFWRLQTYPIVAANPARVGPRQYTFDPTGLDVPLYRPAQTPQPNRQTAPRSFLPTPLDRTPVVDASCFEVWLAGANQPQAASEMAIADLTDWPPSPASVTVDPLLGRIACPPGQTIRAVSYWYAFSGDVGCGPYPRQRSVARRLADRPITWRALVGKTLQTDAAHGQFATLAEAIQAWNGRPPGEAGVVALLDNGTCTAPTDPIVVPSGSFLTLLGARCADPGDRSANGLIASGLRPCVRGDLTVLGTAPDDAEPGDMLVDGLLFDGSLAVAPGNLGVLEIRHTTLVPLRGGVQIKAANPRLRLTLNASISGPLQVFDPTCVVHLAHSIVDASAAVEVAVDAVGTRLDVRGCTIMGSTLAGVLDASDSLFTGTVTVDRRQVGGVECSFVPPGSRTAHRHRCQPDLALAEAASEEHAWIRARLVPDFTSTRYGDAGYAQLTQSTPSEIRAGATNDGEMGAFYLLYQPLRMTSFLTTLQEFLPAGRDVGVFFMS